MVPTLRGVGVVKAGAEIQLDRYSARSGDNVAVSFLDAANPHSGWKLSFNAPQSWASFTEVDFAKGRQKVVEVRAKSGGGGDLEIRLDKLNGPVIARIKVDGSTDWKIAQAKAKKVPGGTHDLFVSQIGVGPVEVDWVRLR